MLVDCVRQTKLEGPLARPFALACCAANFAPAAVRTIQESKRAWLDDEIGHTRGHAAYVTVPK